MKLTKLERDIFKKTGKKGGKVAASRMSAKQRTARARNAAKKRWAK